ncbi:MAG: FKBP-type peptidyl-prolyl cis-trans isomerase [Gemmatimonas sp.]
MSSSPTPEFRQARFGAPLLLIAAALTACSVEDVVLPSDPATETFAPSLGVNIASMTVKASGLWVQDLIVGSGLEAISGRQLQVVYTGWFTNGQQFDKSSSAGIPITLGRGQVIAGWDLGLVGMRPGGKRKLVIGSELAYGSSGSGTAIGPNKTLVFDVTLSNVV